MQGGERLLSPSQAGRLFEPQVGPDRVRDLVDSGDLPAVRTASGWRLIPERAVRLYVAARQQKP
jgi:hypothetical protein